MSMLVTIGVVGTVARHLGPADFGHLNAVLAVMAIAVPWATLSLDAVVVRELVRRPDETGATLGTAFGLRLLGGVTAILGVALLGRFTLAAEWSLLVLASISLLFQAQNVVDQWFQRHLASRRSVVSRTLVIYLGAAVKIGLVVADAPLVAFVATIVLEAALHAIALTIAYRTATQRASRWCWDATVARRLVQGGFPLALAGLVAALGGRFDQLLVAMKLSDHTAGLYLAVNRFTEFGFYAGGALIASLYPALSAAEAHSEDFRRKLQQVFDAVTGFGWLSAIGFTVLAPVLVQFVLGPQYEGAVPALIARAWIGVLLLSAAVRWHAVLLIANPWWTLATAGTTVAVQLALAPVMLDRWGMLGAAAALAVGALTGGVFTTAIFPPLRPLAGAQWRGLAICLRPWAWRDTLRALTH